MKKIFSAKRTPPPTKALNNTPAIQGHIESINNFQIEGWAINREKSTISIAIRIGRTEYPLSANWFDRTDIADQFGTEYLKSGFKIDLPSNLVDTFLKARQRKTPIVFIANKTPLVMANNLLNNANTKTPVNSSKNPEIRSSETLSVKTTNTVAVNTIKDPEESKKVAVKNTIKGYIEQINCLQIEGWVLCTAMEPIELSIQIDKITIPLSVEWLDRPDVAEQFGNDFFLSGFKSELSEPLSQSFFKAYNSEQQIDIFANGHLVNRTEISLAEPKEPTSKTLKKAPLINSLDKPIEDIEPKENFIGNIESLENLKLIGWVVKEENKTTEKQSKASKPLEFAIVFGKLTYPVSPIWIERIDVAAEYGQDFLNSGFELIVPEDAIDKFIANRNNGGSFSITVNNVLLKNNVKPLPQATVKNKTSKDLINIPDDSIISEKPKSLGFRFSFEQIFKLNAKCGIEITSKDFNDLMQGQASFPILIDENNHINADYYFNLAKEHLLQQRDAISQQLLKISLCFGRRAETLEMLANIYFEKRDYETANQHYEAAAASPGQISKWLFSNLGHCKKQLSKPQDVIQTLLDGFKHNPESSMYRDRFDDALQEFWLKQQGALEALAVTNDRQGLVEKMTAVSSFIYNAYLRFYGVTENPQWVGSCNAERVLIVGDFFIPQCVRYRIDQKVEQLKLAGKQVTAISWTDLASQQNALALHDVVIFYRVPAEVQVLKAMAQVNATGRLSIYEIDDLLFDQAYPPPLETYGGYLDLNIYLQLFKGMGSFNAAARYCRFGMASTQALADKLQPLVFGGQCFLHRNGLDSLNAFRNKPIDLEKPTLDIFYGSGTMAHNSDFTDLALPGISRILDEFPKAQLVIVGYLKLPSAFLKLYGNRVKQSPPAKSIKAYWSMLEHADINLAVLHDDLINGCKSELKWFEAACVGIPSVLSTTANYRDVIMDGEDGLLAATSNDWYTHLKLLIEQPELRQQMAKAAQLRAQAEYSVAALADNITKVLAQAIRAAQPENRPQRQKVALVNVFFPPQSIGGATRVVADNFELLQKDYADQFELCVFTSDADHKPPYQMTMYAYEGVRVYRSTILWREHMDWHPRDEKMGELFAAFLTAEKPDMVHFHCIQRLTASAIEATQKAGIPYMVTVHDAWWISDYQFLVDGDNKVYPEGHPDPYETYTPPGNISWETSNERILYLKDLLHGARHVLTVSKCFADIYRKNMISEIVVNKNGISGSLPWQPKNTRDKTRVVCGHIGGMAEHKGYNLLKAAIEALQPKNLEMLVVDHSQEDGYIAQDYWGQVPVTFIGRVKQTNIADLYRRIDVLFAPSIWPESYGLVTREAAACGCWVVASNLGGIGEDVIEGKSGFVIDPTLEALTDCLEKIDAKPALFKEEAMPGDIRAVDEQVNELIGHYRNIE